MLDSRVGLIRDNDLSFLCNHINATAVFYMPAGTGFVQTGNYLGQIALCHANKTRDCVFGKNDPKAGIFLLKKG